ncbi:MAG TPA: DUF3644 domain-containing protein [Acidimicrobiia bacterium]
MATKWRDEVETSKHEALQAVDLYDRPAAARSTGSFFLHMHRAWLALLRARFERSGRDEAHKWDLTHCIEERWDPSDPVRKNLELTISLHERMQHRDEAAVAVAAAGYVQAMLLNYEEELTSTFGAEHSVADDLRFPVYVATFTPDGVDQLRRTRESLPTELAQLIADSRADPAAGDQRFEFRLHLLPKQGPRPEAEVSMTFLREEELNDEQRDALAGIDTGTVIVRERHRPVSNVDKMKPGEAARKIERSIPFRFSLYYHFILAWKRLNVRPDGGARFPERTDERYCVYDAAHHDYLYTDAFVDLVVERISTAAGFEEFFGFPPQPKAGDPAAATRS